MQAFRLRDKQMHKLSNVPQQSRRKGQERSRYLRQGARWYTTPPVGHPPLPSSAGVSRSMRSNRSSGTKPELALARLLRKRISGKTLPGRPDFVFRDRKVAVFVHGCYWHRCPVHAAHLPRTHRAYWKRKFLRNLERDKLNREELKEMGWKVIEVWEHEIMSDGPEVARRISRVVRSS